jgi:catechol 2,3-dioxygenase-like lactoylglutathione lyase family enzyme
MPVSLDHIIVRVNDLEESAAFWVHHLGLADEGRDGPFAMLRVDPSTMIQLAPFGGEGNEHYAFGFAPAEFDAAFARIQEAGIPYGDTFHEVGNMKGPGDETGATGPGRTVYFFDPNHHLLEVRSV